MTDCNESSTYLELIRSIPYDDTTIDVGLFMERLSPIERQIVLLLINDQDLFAISDELRLSLELVQSVVKQLQRKAMEYLDVDIK